MSTEKIYKFRVYQTRFTKSLVQECIIDTYGTPYLGDDYRMCVFGVDAKIPFNGLKVLFTNFKWVHAMNPDSILCVKGWETLANSNEDLRKDLRRVTGSREVDINLRYNEESRWLETLCGIPLTGKISPEYLNTIKSEVAPKHYNLPKEIECKWDYSLDIDKMKVGCHTKTYEEWEAWLESDEIFETRRGTEEFAHIEGVIRAGIAYTKTVLNAVGCYKNPTSIFVEANENTCVKGDGEQKHFTLLLDRKKIYNSNTTIYRIIATRDSANAKAGQLGGWVESEKNITDSGWVGDNAIVTGNAVVSDEAVVQGSARVYGNAKICGHAIVESGAQVLGNGIVSGCAIVTDHAVVSGVGHVTGSVVVRDKQVIWNGKIR
jgi:hypothetical protein